MAASFVSALIAFRVFAPFIGREMVRSGSTFFAGAGLGMSPEVMQSTALRLFALGVLPILGVATLFGVAAGVGQVGFVIAPKAATPKFSNLSPKRGLDRLKPATAAWELAKSGLKLGLLAAVIWQPIADGVERIAVTGTLDGGLSNVIAVAWNILMRAALLAVVIGVADYAVQRRKTEQGMKMAKHEVKREAKDDEGDPLVRGQRRRRAMEMNRNRLLNVLSADVVVTNPTHFAVALSYSDGDPAPRVIAKGTDRQAKKMRRTASRHGIPVIEQRPLARALYRQVKVGKLIPASLYEAAAVVLAEAYRRRGRIAA